MDGGIYDLLGQINAKLKFSKKVKLSNDGTKLTIYKRKAQVRRYKIHTSHKMILEKEIQGTPEEIKIFLNGMAIALNRDDTLDPVEKNSTIDILSRIELAEASRINSTYASLALIGILIDRHRDCELRRILKNTILTDSQVDSRIRQARAIKHLGEVGIDFRTIRKYHPYIWQRVHTKITKSNRNEALRLIKKYKSNHKKIRSEL